MGRHKSMRRRHRHSSNEGEDSKKISQKDSRFFNDYSIDLRSMKEKWDLLSVSEIQETNLPSSQLSGMLVSQLELRDTFIDSLIAKFKDMRSKGQELEEENALLKRKLLDLRRKELDSTQQEFDKYQKQRTQKESRSEEEVKHKHNKHSYTSPKTPEDDTSLLRDSSPASPRTSSSPSRGRERSRSGSPSISWALPSIKKRESISSDRDESEKKDKTYDDDRLKALIAMALKTGGCDSKDGIAEFSNRLKRDKTYEGGSGFYYDASSGYYYNDETGLYYDSQTGTYFYYDYTAEAYKFHSQIPVKEDSGSTDKSESSITKENQQYGDGSDDSPKLESSHKSRSGSRSPSSSSRFSPPVSKIVEDADYQKMKGKEEESDEEDARIKDLIAKAFEAQVGLIHGRSKSDDSDLSEKEEGEIDDDCDNSDNSDDYDKSSGVGWQAKEGLSISEQVAAAAVETVKKSGYVYQEESGLYFDHTSGYYYNAKSESSITKENQQYGDGSDDSPKLESSHKSRSGSRSPSSSSRFSPPVSKIVEDADYQKMKGKEEESDEEDARIKDLIAKAFEAQVGLIHGRSKSDDSDLSEKEEGEIDDDCDNSDNSDDYDKSSGVGWQAKEGLSISEQVAAAAVETVKKSGYVYQEESGLYFDHTSGYYYNAENGLYYDPKTGTYFYFDHVTHSYKFHSQIPAEEDAKTEENVNGTNGSLYSRLSSDDKMPESAADIPPSLRLMVTASDVDDVNVGDLHLVTKDGGRVGRSQRNLISLLDISISENHAEFFYRSQGRQDHHYFIKDLGSKSGTLINGTPISIPMVPSEEIEIGHGWELQFGSVKLKCHIHPGYLSCNECEPGLVLAKLNSNSAGQSSSVVKTSVEKARRKELKKMKKKYAINAHVPIVDVASGYKDRAKKRRKEKGSDNPYEKTEVASMDTEIGNKNKGFGMLQKMGWSKGQSLGKSKAGITKPIEPASNLGREGLGFGAGVPVPPPLKSAFKRKKILDITADRFFKS